MQNMLRTLRFRLSLLYLAASLGLVALLGVGTYGLLALYFQRSTDLALQYKMSTEFHVRGLTLPDELAAAEQAWMQEGTQPALASLGVTPIPESESASDEEDLGAEATLQPVAGVTSAESEGEARYDGRLAPVFVVPEVRSPASAGVPVVNDPAAISGALRKGSDLRTTSLGDGRRLRLLTYRIGNGSVLQVGRLLSDQDRLLAQYLVGLLIMGSTASVVLAVASWAMAGRSIKPAQQAWDQQQQFISNASHELRTPLTLLRANADYALRSRSAAEREKSLRDILDECDYMNRMVEDLLLLSRLDAHRLVLSVDPVALPEFLTETVRQVERIATAKGVTLTLGPVQGSVRGDKVRMRQALLVVLDNALRFTPSGGTISLSAQVRGREVVLSVTDNGLGISREHLPHIFERFYQVPGQPGEGHGNGLGLSIARGLVEAHRGRMAVTSRKDVGTTVQIIFPLAGPRTGPSRSVRGT